MMSLSFITVNAASRTKTTNFSLGTAKASETITFTVTLATISNPSVSYKKSGTNGMYQNNVWLTYTGISNKLSKKISGDTATYTINSNANWIDSNRQNASSGTVTTKFTYSGTLK